MTSEILHILIFCSESWRFFLLIQLPYKTLSVMSSIICEAPSFFVSEYRAASCNILTKKEIFDVDRPHLFLGYCC